MNLREAWRRLVAGHDLLFASKWRGALQREAQRQEDALIALVYLSAFGIDDPSGLATMELTPELIDGFHRWHRAHGIDRFPESGVCC